MATIDRPFGRHLEDFEVGDVYRHWPGKTITEYDDHLFCMITMNHHPLHTNEWFAEHETVQGRNGLRYLAHVLRREDAGDAQRGQLRIRDDEMVVAVAVQLLSRFEQG